MVQVPADSPQPRAQTKLINPLVRISGRHSAACKRSASSNDGETLSPELAADNRGETASSVSRATEMVSGINARRIVSLASVSCAWLTRRCKSVTSKTGDKIRAQRMLNSLRSHPDVEDEVENEIVSGRMRNILLFGRSNLRDHRSRLLEMHPAKGKHNPGIDL